MRSSSARPAGSDRAIARLGVERAQDRRRAVVAAEQARRMASPCCCSAARTVRINMACSMVSRCHNFAVSIESQTSPRDKAFLLAAQRLIRDAAPAYDYLEIGSFSAAAWRLSRRPGLPVDPVDRRAAHAADERGALFDYAGVSPVDARPSAPGGWRRKTQHADGPIDTLRRPAGPSTSLSSMASGARPLP